MERVAIWVFYSVAGVLWDQTWVGCIGYFGFGMGGVCSPVYHDGGVTDTGEHVFQCRFTMTVVAQLTCCSRNSMWIFRLRFVSKNREEIQAPIESWAETCTSSKSTPSPQTFLPGMLVA
ncbi:uncharacterized protein P884DRAFT_30856 [Thermothelomyces heterothallicus CBS 202.75]|uniref:uncharacterized protein n=1 Tax=Thermothelomyces heterothallicus CBS 202.75 TaxID=1149848 RepID=UPI003743A0DF